MDQHAILISEINLNLTLRDLHLLTPCLAVSSSVIRVSIQEVSAISVDRFPSINSDGDCCMYLDLFGKLHKTKFSRAQKNMQSLLLLFSENIMHIL